MNANTKDLDLNEVFGFYGIVDPIGNIVDDYCKYYANPPMPHSIIYQRTWLSQRFYRINPVF